MALVVNAVGFSQARLEVRMLNGHVLLEAKQAAETGLARFDEDDLPPATRARLRTNLERRRHATTVRGRPVPGDRVARLLALVRGGRLSVRDRGGTLRR
jgi:hypothetical protein